MNLAHLPYPDYTLSTMDWVGTIPADWKVMPFFVHAPERRTSNRGMIEDNLLSLSYGRVKQKNIETNEGLLPASFETYQIIERDDVVFRLTDLQNDWRSLRSAKCSQRGIITSAYLVVKPREIHAGYFSHLMRSYDLSKVFYALGSGLRQSLKYSDMKRLPLLVPPLPEQTQIAKFLDYETAKIDALIEKQQQLIALLKEKRQAVISHAVTKGLNPDAPMRDSGVEWLGEVPAHWSVGDLGYALDQVGDLDHHMPSSVEQGVPYVMTGDLKDFASQIDFDSCKQVAIGDYHRLSKKIKTTNGDIILAKYATVGSVSYVDIDQEFLVSYSCATIKPNAKKTTGEYLFYYMKSDCFSHGIRQKVNTNTQENIGNSALKKVKVALPPIEEQRAIADRLDKGRSQYEQLIDTACSAVDLLQERRTALISAAVTGKIDVREWTPSDELAEVEAA